MIVDVHVSARHLACVRSFVGVRSLTSPCTPPPPSPGKPVILGQPTCRCAPFARAMYWAGFTLVGSLTWLSAAGGRRLAPGVLHPNQDRRPPPGADGEDEGGASPTGMPEDRMALFGSMAIQH